MSTYRVSVEVTLYVEYEVEARDEDHASELGRQCWLDESFTSVNGEIYDESFGGVVEVEAEVTA
jgi:hypothetical protein